jgi:hypothetical protein
MLRRWDTAGSAETKDKLFDFFVGKTGIFSVITGQLAERGECYGDYEGMKFPRDNFLDRGQAHFETGGLSKLESLLRGVKARSSPSVPPADLLGYLRSSVVTVKRDRNWRGAV